MHGARDGKDDDPVGNHFSRGTQFHDPFELSAFDGRRALHLQRADITLNEPVGLETDPQSDRLVVEDYDHSESARDYYGVDSLEDHSHHVLFGEQACEIFQVQDDVGAQDYDETEAQRHLLPAGIASEGYDDAEPGLVEGIF